MNRTIAFFAIAWMCLGGCGREGQAPEATRPGGLRVVTYNTHKFVPAGKTVEALKEAKADIILLQEVDRGTERAAREDQPELIRRGLGMNGYYGASHPANGGETGMMILSRYPVREGRLIQAEGSDPPAATALVDTPGGVVRVVAVHMTATMKLLDDKVVKAATAARIREAGAIREALAGETGPVIVGGDFNALDWSKEYGILRGGLTDTGRALGATWPTLPAEFPLVRVDYVLVSKHFKPAALRTRRSVSDHLMVIADIMGGR